MDIKKIFVGGAVGAGIVLVALAGMHLASAALTFSGTNISGDSAINIDTSSTISIGASSSTGITINRPGVTTTFPGSVTIASTTYTNDIVVAAGPVIDVRAYGAKEDGVTDNTAAIQAAINATTKGATLLFPCTNGKRYIVNSPLSFASLYQVTIEGSNRDSGYCGLQYSGTAPAVAAFNFIGAVYVTVENLSFNSANTAYVPDVVLMLGRPTGCGSGGADIFDNVAVFGYAQSTMIYSIASESVVWDNPHFIKSGGGAPYIYYQSTHDTLGLNPPGLCTSWESDLSHRFIGGLIADYGPSTSSPNSAIYLDGGQGGDDVFRDGDIYEPAPGSGFTINSTGYGDVTIESIRTEGAATFLYVATSSDFSGLRLLRNTLGNSNPYGESYMLNTGSNVYLKNADIESNAVPSGTSSTSAFPTMEDSRIFEDYPYTVTSSTNSLIFDLQSGVLKTPLLVNGNVGIGTTAPSTTLHIAGTLPTLRIGASSLAGCLEIGNSDGSAGINYITVLDGVITATTTQSSICQ